MLEVRRGLVVHAHAGLDVEDAVDVATLLLLVLGRHADEGGDHPGRELGGEVGDVVEAGGADVGVEQLGADLADARLEPRDAAGGEGPGHERAEPRVVGRVLEDHHVRVVELGPHALEHGVVGRAEGRRVAAGGLDVVEAAEGPEVEVVVAVHGSLVAQAPPDRVRVVVDDDVVGVPVEVAVGVGLGGHGRCSASAEGAVADGAHWATEYPPLTGMVWPVIQGARSLARKTVRLAMSDGQAPAPDGVALDQPVVLLLLLGAGLVRVHGAEGDAVGGDAVAADLTGDAADQAGRPRLGRGVGGHERLADAGGVGDDGDHPPGLALDHPGQHGPGDVHDAEQVHPDEPVPRGGVLLGEGLHVLEAVGRGLAGVAGVVHEDVDRAHGGDGPLDRGPVGDVEGRGARPARRRPRSRPPRRRPAPRRGR